MKFQATFAAALFMFSPLLGQGGQTRYADLSFSALFAGGGATVSGERLLALQPGAHDPHLNGFTVQNLEMSAKGAVDPFFDGEIHLIFQIDENGESLIELEEAFLTSRAFPMGLQLRAGTYFTEFGRLNPQHPHSWAWVDQPLVSNRFLGGDGLRGPGARLSWLTPLPWYSEITMGLQNANGETAVSFLGEEDEEIFGHLANGERSVETVEDLLKTARFLNSIAVVEVLSLNAGLSGAWGPNRILSNGSTFLLGADLYLKWQPSSNDNGWPFISAQWEFISRNFKWVYPDTTTIESNFGYGTSSGAEGYYLQVQFGFKRGWVAGARMEDVESQGFGSGRSRLASNLTYYPSEFSKVRLQINRDDGRFLNEKPIWAAWLQIEFLMGQHGGHKF